jgi:hypothetical protein
MRKRAAIVATLVILSALCAGGTCRQETTQDAIGSFFNTLAAATASEIVDQIAP